MGRPSPVAAIALTAGAVAAINLALASLIAQLAGFAVVGPSWPLALGLLALGVLAAAAAVALWRRYLQGIRE